ncbi:MAG: response regulator [Ignavibacteria bacterium]|nr:response regulator [Ignavibacteria bacterium]
MIYTISVIILVIMIEVLIRTVVKKASEKKLKEHRQKALKESLSKDYSKISSSLKRVELQNPLARILIVEKDEELLDKLRSLLVLDGYSVDSVTSGMEAYQLCLLNHYDFVFTGEKTKDISGEELTNRMKQKRPDIDVIIITESVSSTTPYDLIKEGAIDFIQKPYVDNRLNDFVRKHLSKRREKIKSELEKSIKTATLTENIPAGYFLLKNHIWGYIEENGFIRFGLDTFAMKLLGIIDTIDFANLNIILSKENPLFVVKKNTLDIYFKLNLDGLKVVGANVKIRENFEDLYQKPYKNWICKIETQNIKEIVSLAMFGKEADDYINTENEKLEAELSAYSINYDKSIIEQFDNETIQKLVHSFFEK